MTHSDSIRTGQFRVRKPKYDTWALARFIRIGDPYSQHMRDLWYCQSYGMQETGGTWTWGCSGEFPLQVGIAGLELYYTPIGEAEAAALAEEQLRRAQAHWNAAYPAHAHGMTIKSFGARRAQELTPDQLLTSYRATLLVIDHITDATQTARAVVVRDMASGQERITTDPVEIRALHDHATAKPCGNGSYTVEIDGGMANLETSHK